MQAYSSKPRITAILSILLIVVVWGSAASVTKYAVESIPPFTFALLRNLVASICLLPFFLYQQKRDPQKVPRKSLWKIAWMGMTGVTFFYLFFNIAFYFSTAAVGALIQGFIPVAIIVLAVIFLKEKLRLLQIAGIVLSVVGVVMISFVGIDPGARNPLLGNILMIAAVLCWGIYTVISKSLKENNPVYVTTISTWIGTAGLVPAVVIELWNKDFPVISTGGWWAIIYLGLFSSAICYILYNRVVSFLPAVQVGNFMNLDPVFGAFIAVMFLGDRITSIQIIGAILVLAGVMLTSKKERLKG